MQPLTGRASEPRVGPLLLLALRELFRRKDPNRPESFRTTPESDAVLDHAHRLAREGREDSAAVAELRAVAEQRRQTLKLALAASRFAGYYQEYRHANLVYRLLVAATADTDVPDVTASHRRLIAAVEELQALPEQEQWARIVDLQPRLRVLENQVRSGAFGSFTRDEPTEATLQRARRQIGPDGRTVRAIPRDRSVRRDLVALQTEGRHVLELTARLRHLVGPSSDNRHHVLGSQVAFDVAFAHLHQAASRGPEHASPAIRTQ